MKEHTNSYSIEDITAGESWGCEFTVRTWMNTASGEPADPPEQAPTELSDVQPGEWSSWGVIATRDTENQLLEVQDAQVDRTWIVPFSDARNIDRVEYAPE